MKHLFLGIVILSPLFLIAQNKEETDSLFIHEYEEEQEPDKVLHAEPLYIDLIRDLGARKGEREWNVGFGLSDDRDYDDYEFLVEYEFAPINRLGLEIELPFSFFSEQEGIPADSVPSNQLDGLQLALQWSFFVDQQSATSMAIGYLNEFEFSDFDNFGDPLIKGNVYNPFFVIAKRWGNNFHTLIYTGPEIEQSFERSGLDTDYLINTNIHYMISGTRNFIGLEMNKEFSEGDFDLTLRPQLRLEISEPFLIGIVTGIPVSREQKGLSAFFRVIWEP